MADANFDLKVNMLKCEATDTKGQTKRFSWVTDLPPHRKARDHRERNLYLWNRLRELVRTFAFLDWETLYRAIAGELGKEDYVGLIRAGPRPSDRTGHARPTPISPIAKCSEPGQPPGQPSCAPETERPCRPLRTAVGRADDQTTGNCCLNLDAN